MLPQHPRSLRSPARRLAIPALSLLSCVASVSGQNAPVQREPRDVHAGDPSGREKSYRAATGLLNRGMYELAEAEYRLFLNNDADDPRVPAARYGLAVCLFRLGKPAEASAVLGKIVALTDFEFAADSKFLRGQCAMATGQLKDAADRFASLVKEHPASSLTASALALEGECHYLSADPESARRVFAVFAERPSSDVERDRVDLLWSLADVQTSRHREAAERLGVLRSRSPRGAYWAQATLAEAQCLQLLGEADRALPLYEAAIAIGVESVKPDAMLGLGQIHRAAGKAELAAKVLDELISSYGSLPVALNAKLERGRLYLDTGQVELALSLLSPLTKPSQDGTLKDFADEAEYRCAQCELKLGRPEAAAARLAALDARSPRGPLGPAAAFDRAWALQQSGKIADAMRAFAAFRDRFPNDARLPDSLVAQATLAHRRELFDECAALCTEFLGRAPAHSSAATMALLFADSEYFMKRYSSAVKAYGKFEAGWPDDRRVSRARIRRGLSLVAQGEQAVGLPLLQSAVADPAGVDRQLLQTAYATLGDAAFEKAEWASAERWFLELSKGAGGGSKVDGVGLKLALCIHRQGRVEQALAAYEALMAGELSADDTVQAEFERSQALVELGHLDRARAGFERVLKSGQSSAAQFRAPSQRQLAAIALRRGRPDDAADLLAGASSEPSAGISAADATLERAQALIAAKRFGDARAAFDSFILRFPNDARVAEAKAHRAITLVQDEKNQESLLGFDEITAQVGTLPPALRTRVRYEIAWANKALGKDDAASKAYRAVLADTPDALLEGHALIDLASLEIKGGRETEAVALLRRVTAAADAPGSIVAELFESGLYMQGLCEFRMGSWQEATKTLGQYVQRFPSSSSRAIASLMLGDALLKLGQNADSVDAYSDATKSVELTVQSQAWMKLGHAAALAARWQQSEEAYASFLDRFPDDRAWHEAGFGIGWARENSGKLEAAIEAYRDVTARYQGETAARAQFQIGECLFELGRFEAAAGELLKVDILYAYPEWSAAGVYEAGRCLAKLGRAEDSQKQFRSVVERFSGTEWARLAADQISSLGPAALPGQDARSGATNKKQPKR